MLSGADFCPESIASAGICTERTFLKTDISHQIF
jgi:hypothetical protein